MTDNTKKVSELPPTSSVANNDLVLVVTTSNAQPSTRKATFTAVSNYINSMIPTASNTVAGIVQVGNNINFTNGVVSLPLANYTNVGVVGVGNNLYVDTLGFVSAAVANTTAAGVIKIGNNVSVNATGYLNVPTANVIVAGVIKVGNNLTINSTGFLSLANTFSALPNTGASIGYVLTAGDSSGSNVKWQAFGGVYDVTSIATRFRTRYTVSSNDSVILVNPAVVGANVTITLPIGNAIEGKEILVKLIDASSGYKVTVNTDDIGNAYLENPITGSFVTSYDLIDSGQAETWIHDGNVYRHLSTARATPIFYTNANTYAQVVIKNASAGNNASSDLVLYNNIGNESTGLGPYIDLGINSNTYSNSLYSIGGPNDGYLFVDNYGYNGGNLTIGTAYDTAIVFHTNGTTADKKVLTINSTSIMSYSNVTPYTNTYSLGNTTSYWKTVYTNTTISNTITTSNITQNNFSWLFGNTGVLKTPGNIIPSVNATYSLGNSTMRWESLWVGGNSVTFSDQNTSYPDQTLTVANGVFYITDSLNTKTQSNAGLQVGNFLLQNNSIIISNTSADINIGNTGSTGAINFKRKINVRNSTDQWSLLSVDPQGRVDVISEIVSDPANAAFSITSSRTRSINQPNNPGVLLQLSGSSTAPTRLYNDSYGAGNYSAFIGRHARGPSETPTQTLAGDTIARFGANPYGTDGFAALSTARVDIVNTEDQRSTNKGSEIQLWTTANGSATISKRLTVNETGIKVNSGNVTFSDGSVQNTAFNSTTAVTRVNVGAGLTQSANVGIVGIDSTAVLSVSGATNQISVANTGGNYSLSLPQAIATTSDVQFRNLTVANLTVTGVTTSAGANTIHDKIFRLAYDSTSSSQIDGGGFTLGNTSSAYYVGVTYNLANNSWNTGGTNLITNNLSAAANVTANNGYFTGSLHAGANYIGYDYPNADFQIDCNINSYNQMVQQNHNGGTQASTDYVAVNDIGNDGANYIDLGINSSTYANNQYSMGGPNDGYLYVNGGNLDIATQTQGKTIQFYVGNTTSNALRATIDSTGLTVVGNVVANNISGNFTGSFSGSVSGTANNTNYVGTVAAANVVSNAQLIANLANYQTTAGLSANVAKLTANLATYIIANTGLVSNSSGVFVNTAYIDSIVAGDTTNFQTKAGLASNVATLTANNTSFVGSVSAANVVSNAQLSANLNNYALLSALNNYQSSAGLAANVAVLTSNNTAYVGSVAAANVVSNAQLTSNLANYVLSSTLTASLAGYQTTAGLSANVASLTSNNTSFVGTVAAANVVSNAQLIANLANYATISGLASNLATLTANNTSFVGTVAAANVVSNTQLLANLANYQTLTGLNSNVAALGYMNTSSNYTISGIHTYNANLVLNNGISANGTYGTNGQVLTTNGTAVYWKTSYPDVQVFSLEADRTLATSNAAQSLFGKGVTLVSDTKYRYKIVGTVYKSNTSLSSTGALQFAITNSTASAVLGRNYFMASPCAANNSQSTLMTAFQMSQNISANFNTPVTITNSNTGATWYNVIIDGVIDVTTGGVINPQIAFTHTANLGSGTILQNGATMEIWPVGNASSNSVIGTWA